MVMITIILLSSPFNKSTNVIPLAGVLVGAVSSSLPLFGIGMCSYTYQFLITNHFITGIKIAL